MEYLLICDNGKVEQKASLCREECLGIEVQSFFLPQVLSNPEIEIKRHENALRGITRRSLHGPFAELALGSIDPLISCVVRNRIRQSVSVARKLGIEQIILHHGYYPNTSKPSAWIKLTTELFRDILSTVPENIVFHLENLFEDDPGMLIDVIDSINDPRVDICFDTGHAHAMAHLPVTEWIERLKCRIGYVHLHSNNGRHDEHLCLTRGNMPVKDVCAALEYYVPKAVWAIEVHMDNLSNSLDWLRKEEYL